MFTAASALAVLSRPPDMLIAARRRRVVGGGRDHPLSLVLLTTGFPARARGKVGRSATNVTVRQVGAPLGAAIAIVVFDARAGALHRSAMV